MAASAVAPPGGPTRGRRRCPLCSRSFRSGWEGVETHWRARHKAALGYERFWSSLCREHKAPRAADCPDAGSHRGACAVAGWLEETLIATTSVKPAMRLLIVAVSEKR